MDNDETSTPMEPRTPESEWSSIRTQSPPLVELSMRKGEDAPNDGTHKSMTLLNYDSGTEHDGIDFVGTSVVGVIEEKINKGFRREMLQPRSDELRPTYYLTPESDIDQITHNVNLDDQLILSQSPPNFDMTPPLAWDMLTGSTISSLTNMPTPQSQFGSLSDNESCLARLLPPEISAISDGKKRVRQVSLSDNESDVEDKHNPKGRKKSNGMRNEEPLLACPFYKRFPGKHHDCSRYVLKRGKDVKQHLKRLHTTPALYCARCYQTFHNTKDRDEHARDAKCPVLHDPQFEGVTEDQRKKLDQSTKRSKSLEEQWHIIWDVIFPGVEHPKSPFMGNPQTEAVSLLRDLWNRRGADILASVPDNGRFSPVDMSAHMVMERLFDQLEEESGAAKFSARYGSLPSPSTMHDMSDHLSQSIFSQSFMEEPLNMEVSDTFWSPCTWRDSDGYPEAGLPPTPASVILNNSKQ
ncbi:putative C2H2-type domain-containing protein [Seiridium cardinale]|uniref:C2H2-type domain-containing protein n=1 Tax=Seiridium cardinale TaxID=138064 RepID=A0ABR2XN16_9PEZI